MLGVVGDVPGVAVGDVVPDWFHWPELVEPEALEPEVLEPDVAEPAVPESIELLPEVVEPVAELSLAPLELVVSVVLQAARPKHRAAAKIALVMVMISSFSRELMVDSSVNASIGCNKTAFHYPSKSHVSARGTVGFNRAWIDRTLCPCQHIFPHINLGGNLAGRSTVDAGLQSRYLEFR
ncbi:hypothetical protein GCM10007387_53400 [Pseudoduganella albidiflava]|uniref:Uncharacterized protein n=1 Tax=Pseudoduganella albidiflava TaxID=321983 RepID=A0AA87XZP3_9BURK|nr:hypothetical protein GCM10007387_53400 [Pseudoduganella albidiflava]